MATGIALTGTGSFDPHLRAVMVMPRTQESIWLSRMSVVGITKMITGSMAMRLMYGILCLTQCHLLRYAFASGDIGVGAEAHFARL